MVHIGEPAFFQRVFADAFSHEIVLVEGLRSPVTRAITRSYRWLAKSTTLNLITQPRYPAQDQSTGKIVHADLSGEEFMAIWRKVPLWQRGATHVGSALVGAVGRWYGTRAMLAANLGLNDLPSRKETLSFTPEFLDFNHAISGARDQRLIERLAEQLDRPDSAARRLAIVYGAHHMRAVLTELIERRRFYPERSEWLTVFTL